VAGTVKRAVILACCWLLALYLSAWSWRQGTLSQPWLGVLFLSTSSLSGGRKEPFDEVRPWFGICGCCIFRFQ
jgi:hypothetical protein